jgi:hypothetical protein
MVHMIIGELNALPPVDTEQVKDYMKSWTYFHTYFPQEWWAAVDKLEQHQPLLQLCTSH